MTTTLSIRDLNRALLARQMLLDRERISAVEAVQRLAGMQAQQARPPFIGLWSRIANFDRAELHRAFHDRAVVRATLMRATLHLMSAADYLAIRPALQPALSGAMHAVLRNAADGLDVDDLTAHARAHFARQPSTFGELRSALAQQFPDINERFMGYAVRLHLPLVIVPDDSDWAFPANSRFSLAESWLGKSPDVERSDLLTLRHLAAFGPATARDIQTWSGLSTVKRTLEELRPRLVVFRDERKRELFDLPDAPRPSAETPAPVRFLPEFDSSILAHADRTRIVPDEYRKHLITRNLLIPATFLVDGFVAGTWKAERKRKDAMLTLQPFAPLSRQVATDLTDEAERLIRFIEPDAAQHEVRVLPVES